MRHTSRCCTKLWILALLLALPQSRPVKGDTAAEFLVFPSLRSILRSGLNESSVLEEAEMEAELELFVTAQAGRTRVLVELLASDDEAGAERVQLGWSLGRHLVWLGRFHNPIGYWNAQFHHAAFLQTSITRPAITEFEEDGGILPVHLAGLLLEGDLDTDSYRFGYALAAGVGPELDRDELKPWDVLDAGSRSGDSGVTVNLYLSGREPDSSRLGVFLNRTDIPTTGPQPTHIRQSVAGVYGNWEAPPWRLLGAAYFLDNEIRSLNATDHASLRNTYLQGEYALSERWISFARLETTSGSDRDAYLDLYPDFVEERILAGVKFDVSDSHSLSLEISSNGRREDDYAECLLQWSAQF